MIIIDEIDQPNLYPHFNEITALTEVGSNPQMKPQTPLAKCTAGLTELWFFIATDKNICTLIFSFSPSAIKLIANSGKKDQCSILSYF